MYREADMVIMPSLSENLPTVLIEALACSCPVVAYKTGGIPEIVIDGENGKLVTTYDPDSFLNAILEVKNDLANYKAKTRKSVDTKFDYDSVKYAYFDIFNKLRDDINCDSGQK
jgi:glycosyltransferase involved in cell wall biosynthesis